MQVGELAVFLVTHGCTCSVLPTLNTAVRVELMARQVPYLLVREMNLVASEDFETLFVSFPRINSLWMCEMICLFGGL